MATVAQGCRADPGDGDRRRPAHPDPAAFEATLVRWSGPSGWVFIRVPAD